MFVTYEKNVFNMKWPSLTAKIGKRRKRKFCRIDSRLKLKKTENIFCFNLICEMYHDYLSQNKMIANEDHLTSELLNQILNDPIQSKFD